MVLVNGELYPAVIAWGTAYVIGEVASPALDASSAFSPRLVVWSSGGAALRWRQVLDNKHAAIRSGGRKNPALA